VSVKRLRYQGLDAEYDEYEQRVMRELTKAAEVFPPGSEERRLRVRELQTLHELKALLGATMIRDEPARRIFAGQAGQWDERRNTSAAPLTASRPRVRL
jgi:hypothetical protein